MNVLRPSVRHGCDFEGWCSSWETSRVVTMSEVTGCDLDMVRLESTASDWVGSGWAARLTLML